MVHFLSKWLNALFFTTIFTSCSLMATPNDDPSEIITIALPVNEQILIKTDPYFVSLKRAYKSLNIPVKFLVIPGARSYVMLKKVKISGSYPRYTNIAENSENFTITKGFEVDQSIYAFSLKPIDSNDQLKYALKHQPNKIGTVRGIRIVESYVADQKIRLFNHIDHLVGALKAGKLHLILETEIVMKRYKEEFTPIYRSPKPVIEGDITQILHKKHQDIADLLQNYFEKNPIH